MGPLRARWAQTATACLLRGANWAMAVAAHPTVTLLWAVLARCGCCAEQSLSAALCSPRAAGVALAASCLPGWGAGVCNTGHSPLHGCSAAEQQLKALEATASAWPVCCHPLFVLKFEGSAFRAETCVMSSGLRY